ncbi:MAG: dihydrolipoyl dehydrogenase [Candidatus Nitronauta litoralis]|uniref:Dihydrolipoyl dehydrogenase n=1 Tax=Candidatus Nitronauta litoralis TaxID=2705533 RepID=A0A7T0BWN5_9BACT|nr:MAG: dihydrolipoyl dehydrogenase [Candidatus Nitronauta litoralis]
MDYDVIILGGGSAGYSAADTAERQGARVAIVDPGPLGGLCILRGCMPTKTLLRSSDVISLMKRAREFGLLPVDARADLSAIIDRKNKLIDEFASYRIEQLHNPRFSLIQERGEFISPNEIQAGSKTLSADSIIIATGSVVNHDFSVPGLDNANCLTSDDVLTLREQPESMIVLGGGPVALELAQFYQRIGTQVTLIQRSAHILSTGDEDLARPVEERLREEGMQVFTDTKLLNVKETAGQKQIAFEHEGKEQTVEAATILQALGRRPNIDGLNLEVAGVQTEGGRVRVDAEMRTSQKNIFSIGDVNGKHEIVHIAIEQGEIAGHNALNADNPRRYDDRLKTSVVFTDPQVASVGLSEKECKAQGIDYRAASYPFNDHGKSMCLGETHGHVKLLSDPESGKLLGGHIVGPEAGELIHQLVAIMYFNGTMQDMLNMPYYHPTLSEILTYPADELIL